MPYILNVRNVHCEANGAYSSPGIQSLERFTLTRQYGGDGDLNQIYVC